MLTNRKIFGLDVNRALADVEDADASLRNIGVEPRDLAIIFGASQTRTKLVFDCFFVSNL